MLKLVLADVDYQVESARRVDQALEMAFETVVRPSVARRDFSGLVSRLNEFDQGTTGRWQIDSSELSSAIKFRDNSGKLAASKLTPDVVTGHLSVALSEHLAAEAQHA